MNKNKCAICNKGNGRRRCKKHGDKEICPQCCAGARDKECTGCRHYENARQYESSKTSKPKKRDFIIEINEEVEKAVDDALVRAEKGDIDGARRSLESLRADYPSNYMVIYGIGVIHALSGDLDKAIECFNRATRIFPYFIEAHFNKAVAYQKKLDIKNAVNSYNEVIELGNPNDEMVRMAKKFVENMEADIRNSYHISMKLFFEAQDEFEAGFSLMEDGKWEKAIARFKTAVKLNPDHPQSYGNMGLCYAQMGRKQEALNAFDKAIHMDPDYEPAILNRAFTERLEEGEPLTHEKFESVDYYRDYPRGEKTFIQEKVNAILKKDGINK